jgi:hypothetical protein
VHIWTGGHACFDRIVFDTRPRGDGQKIGYHVQYVKKIFQDGSGEPMEVEGGAILELRVSAPIYYPDTGEPTYEGTRGCVLPGVNIKGYRTFRDTCLVGSLEGDTQVGLGTRVRLPFRVFQVESSLIVDVAHAW